MTLSLKIYLLLEYIIISILSNIISLVEVSELLLHYFEYSLFSTI